MLIFNRGHVDGKMPNLGDGVNCAVIGMGWGAADYLPDLNLKKSSTARCVEGGVRCPGHIDIGDYSGANGSGSNLIPGWQLPWNSIRGLLECKCLSRSHL
ncbi:MAG: hypothetical protein ABSA47_13610 [Verrucomicrobiota bacterium]